MDSKDELRQPLAKKVRQPLTGRVRLSGISQDKLELLLKLHVDWSQTYKTWAVMMGVQWLMGIGFCIFLFLSGEKELVKTEYFAVPHGKLVAIGYSVLMLFTSLVSLVLLKEETHMCFQFWQKNRDSENIIIIYKDTDWIKFQFKTEIIYMCPEFGCPTLGTFFNTYVLYLVAGIIVGSAQMIIGLMVVGFVAGVIFNAYSHIVSLAFDEATLNLLT